MKVLVLDSGHKSGVNIGHDKRYNEGDGNYEWCLALKEFLKGSIDVKIVGHDNSKVRERAVEAKRLNADMYISVHSDAWKVNSGGCTVFESVDLNNYKLGRNIGLACAEALNIRFRGCVEKESTKYPGEDYYGAIDKAQDLGIKNVFLLERAFHSNPSECEKLLDGHYTKKSAEAVGRVIKEFYGIKDEYYTRSLEMDGKVTEFQCVIKEGHLYAGLREVFEGLGYVVDYDNEKQRVIVR
jgi:hypothetical protein